MNMKEARSAVREAVGVFHTVEDLEAAIDELLSSGFDRAELSLLASEQAVEAKLGRSVFGRSELADNPETPRGIYVSPAAMGAAEGGLVGALAYAGGVAAAGLIALAGGPVTAIVVGAVVAGGAGGLFGSGLAEILGHHRAAYFHHQLQRGGLLLWVRAWDNDREQRAVDILTRHSAGDVHVHTFGKPSEPADASVARTFHDASGTTSGPT